MVSATEAPRLSARRQLDDLHRGMVVEIDRRLTSDQPVQSSPQSDEEPEIAEAFDLIQHAVTSLQEMRQTNAEHEAQIVEFASSLHQLQEENTKFQTERNNLSRDLEAAKVREANLMSAAKDFEARISTLEAEKISLSKKLVSIVQTLKASFDTREDRIQ